MSLKFKEDLCVMTIKNDAKFEDELSCRFKIGTRNLRNIDLNTQKSTNLHFNGLLSFKVENA